MANSSSTSKPTGKYHLMHRALAFAHFGGGGDGAAAPPASLTALPSLFDGGGCDDTAALLLPSLPPTTTTPAMLCSGYANCGEFAGRVFISALPGYL